MSGVDLNTGECDGHAVVDSRGELDLADAAGLAAAAAREPDIIKVRWPATAHVDGRHPEGAR
jgi:hypothetical protein